MLLNLLFMLFLDEKVLMLPVVHEKYNYLLSININAETKTLSHFAEIRKQLIWGNRCIMFKNKGLMFDN